MLCRSRKEASGFTLIELLVVIAIIAILAAILFPVFARARETAKVSNCIATIKQVGIAVANYVDDHNGAYPWAPLYQNENHAPDNIEGYAVGQYFAGDTGIEATLPSGKGIPLKRERPLWKYTKTVNMFKCPSEPKYPHSGNKYTDFEWWGNSYPMNAAWDCSNLQGVGLIATLAGESVVEPGKGVRLKWGRKTSTVKRPSRMILAGDRVMHTFFWQPHTTDEGWRNHDKEQPKSVVVFCDGHCKLVLMTPSHEVRVGGRTVKTEGLWDETQGWALVERGWVPGYPNVGAP